jgi:hypothetical protein
VVECIAAAVDADPGITRRALSRQVCQWLEWRGPDGRPREVSCRKALAELQRRGVVDLPECEPAVSSGGGTETCADGPAGVAEVSCHLAELGEVEVVLVSSRYTVASRVWRSLMEVCHYLGAGPLCGCQLRYLLRSPVHGWLGALSFSAAARCLKARDEWIGWSEAARRANLDKVVQNSRFLIVPTVQVPNLASHVLAATVARLPDDWAERYGFQPVLVETFVDGERYSGTCYRAANWVHVGQTAGRRDGYANGKVSTGPKQIYLYPLRKNWKATLCGEPEIVLQRRPWANESGDWAEREFAGALVFDGRLRRRLYEMARDFYARPGVLIPEACEGSTAKMKAAYRFVGNERVDLKGLLKGHVEATAERIRQHEVVLAVQDMSSLNYTSHPATEGLGPINTTKDPSKGLVLHDTLAFDLDGVPLGLLDVQCWARDPKQAGKKYRRAQLPIEQKESFKWLRSYRAVAEVQQLCPQTMLVSVGDREADLYDLFAEVQQNKSGPQVLVRAERSRKRKVAVDDETYDDLWEQMSLEPVAGRQSVFVPRRGSRRARTATLEVRHRKVRLRPPLNTKTKPIELWAVHAVEVGHGPDVKKPLEWMLLTSVQTSTFEEATERLRWYTLRWGIEVYHRTLKSGCRIRDRQLADAGSLQTCLAIDMVVAWRIYTLVKQGRETPDIPCDVFFDEYEWKALYAVSYDKPPPEEPPSLREAVRLIAKLGGFLGRKGDGEPGTTTVWRGLQHLTFIAHGYEVGYERGHAACASSHRQRDGP